MSRHVMEALGKSTVVIEDGKVVSVSEPQVKYCPLFKKYRNIDRLDCEKIRDNIQFRIDDFGMCTERRKIRLDYFLNFGISELLSMAVRDGILDAAVIASDGCGTAVLKDPQTIQGMGGRISAIMETSPIESVIDGLGRENVLDPETAEIDQIKGLAKAFESGCSAVGVTVASAEQSKMIREIYGNDVMIFAVHTTGIPETDAYSLFDTADVITACASLYVREAAKTRALLQAGTKVPIYGASERGADLMRAKLKELGKEPDTVLDDNPYPLL